MKRIIITRSLNLHEVKINRVRHVNIGDMSWISSTQNAREALVTIFISTPTIVSVSIDFHHASSTNFVDFSLLIGSVTAVKF